LKLKNNMKVLMFCSFIFCWHGCDNFSFMNRANVPIVESKLLELDSLDIYVEYSQNILKKADSFSIYGWGLCQFDGNVVSMITTIIGTKPENIINPQNKISSKVFDQSTKERIIYSLTKLDSTKEVEDQDARLVLQIVNNKDTMLITLEEEVVVFKLINKPGKPEFMRYPFDRRKFLLREVPEIYNSISGCIDMN